MGLSDAKEELEIAQRIVQRRLIEFLRKEVRAEMRAAGICPLMELTTTLRCSIDLAGFLFKFLRKKEPNIVTEITLERLIERLRNAAES